MPDEIVAGGHSLAPRFLRYCLAKSRQNLGLRTIDVYYLHNPGQQLGRRGAATSCGRGSGRRFRCSRSRDARRDRRLRLRHVG